MSNPDHRLKIRHALAQHLAGLAENRPHVSSDLPVWASSLESLPVSPHHLISISHGCRIGGYALCEISSTGSRHGSDLGAGLVSGFGSGLVSGLGFDLETLTRLTPAIIERVSHPFERASAPDPRFLWSAKEASFKASLGPQQPVAITEIRIEKWRSVGGAFHTFTASSQRLHLGRGVLYSSPRNDEVFAFFLGIADPLLT